MEYITIPFGYIMKLCYSLLHNYGLAIILFTFCTKIVIFPVSLWTHKNSIKLVKIQPQINFLKAKYYGEKDKISDETLVLYKQEKYHPFLGMIPMVVQIFLLMCVVQIIYNPLNFVLSIDKSVVNEIVTAVAGALNLDVEANSIQLTVLSEIQAGFDLGASKYDSVVAGINSLNLSFLGFNLSAIPFTAKGKMLLVPVFAGCSALALSIFQNRINPLQAEQNRAEQLTTNAISIGISLVLGGFVPAGIGFYWICSNIFAMLQQLVLNVVINPKKHIDYEALEKSREELNALNSFGNDNENKEFKRREKADYKRFFKIENKHFVIYSESNGFFRYFEKTINYILENSNIIIHYITSDPNDNIFKLAEENDRIKAYYFSPKKMITVFMKMDADIVLMTMQDIENFQYKRSYVKKDIEYIYTMHGCISTHVNCKKGCIDHYDTVFCTNEQNVLEIQKQEELYDTQKKNIVVTGYGFLELLQDKYDALEKHDNEVKKILIAPSWQEDNILDSCLDKILDQLLGKGYDITVRPHPEYIKRYQHRLDEIINRYSSYSGNDLKFELDFGSNDSLYSSDVLVSDWSGVAYEFAYVTLKPCIFIDTPPKIFNKDYEELGIEPIEFKLRNKVGKSFPMDDITGLYDTVEDMLQHPDEYSQIIKSARDEYVANYGKSGEVAGSYIIKSLVNKQKSKKGEQK